MTRRWWMASAVAAAAVAACHVDARFEALRTEMPTVVGTNRVTTMTLANGLRVALLADPRSPIASIDLRYEVGAADDPPARSGMALEVAQLLADGPAASAPGPAPRAAVALTTQLAIDLDRTELTTTTLDADAALELAARRLETTCADFTPAAIDRARGLAIAQLTVLPPSLAAAIWGVDHPYAHPIGTGALAAATADELCAFYANRYTPNVATLVVTGPIDAALIARVRTRFARIPRGPPIVRAPIAAIAPSGWTRVPVVGLTKPTAMLVFAAPAPAEPDDAVLELALARLQTFDKLHVALIGAARARAIVIALEADTPAQLDDAHDKLLEDLETASNPGDDDGGFSTDDRLAVARQLDDVLARGGVLAAAQRGPIAGRLRTLADLDAPAGTAHRWIRAQLAPDRARRLDALPSGEPFGSVDVLVPSPAIISDELVSPDDELAIAAPPPMSHVTAQLTLANGLRVVLAPDPDALTIDLRVVMPVGTRHEPAPGLALRAAAELVGDDGWSVGQDAAERVEWYARMPFHSSVEVTATTTRFRTIAVAGAADWHVFALAWVLTSGRYTRDRSGAARDQLAAFRRAAYQPNRATLIVTGNFDPAAIRVPIDAWFGAWHATRDPAPPVTTPHATAIVVAEANGADAIATTFVFRPRAAATTSELRARRAVVATLLRTRLEAVLGSVADVTATYAPRADETLALTAQLDPFDPVPAALAIVREVARLRREPPTAAELAHAQRRTIAIALAAATSVPERAEQLEQAIELGIPFDDLDRELAAIRTLTADDVRAAAAELLEPDDKQLDITGPRAAVVAALTAFGVDPRVVKWKQPPKK